MRYLYATLAGVFPNTEKLWMKFRLLLHLSLVTLHSQKFLFEGIWNKKSLIERDSSVHTTYIKKKKKKKRILQKILATYVCFSLHFYHQVPWCSSVRLFTGESFLCASCVSYLRYLIHKQLKAGEVSRSSTAQTGDSCARHCALCCQAAAKGP